MSKILDLGLGDWNAIVMAFHNESDRGAAVLAAGFADNTLAQYIRFRLVSTHHANKIFGPMAPLGTFSGRIMIAESFGLISRPDAANLDLVRQVRNHFAHHPLETSFNAVIPDGLIGRIELPGHIDRAVWSVGERNRLAYLIALGLFCARTQSEIKPLSAMPSVDTLLIEDGD